MEKVIIKCNRCEAENSDNSRYCCGCGYELQDYKKRIENKAIVEKSIKEQSQIKNRHWFITFFLWLIIVVNSLIAYFFLSLIISSPDFVYSGEYSRNFSVDAIIGFWTLLNVIFAIALLYRKIWGFWAFNICVIGVIIIGVYLSIVGLIFVKPIRLISVLSFLSLLLGSILQIKKDGIKYWEQLE